MNHFDISAMGCEPLSVPSTRRTPDRCVFGECADVKLEGRGLCSRHYQSEKKAGVLDNYPRARMAPNPTQEQLRAQILASARLIRDESGCWFWDGAKDRHGYPQVRANRRTRYISRIMLGLEDGDRRCACHKCDQPKCIRPDHLFVGTTADNVKDMMAKGRNGGQFEKKEFCKRGHRIKTYPSGRRRCWECETLMRWAKEGRCAHPD